MNIFYMDEKAQVQTTTAAAAEATSFSKIRLFCFVMDCKSMMPVSTHSVSSCYHKIRANSQAFHNQKLLNYFHMCVGCVCVLLNFLIIFLNAYIVYVNAFRIFFLFGTVGGIKIVYIIRKTLCINQKKPEGFGWQKKAQFTRYSCIIMLEFCNFSKFRF